MNQQYSLWDVPFQNQLPTTQLTIKCTNSINYIVQKDQSTSDLAKYLHGCAISPVVSTFSKSITKDNFITWPGIDNINFNGSIGTTIATEKGHLDKGRKKLQSTKVYNNTSTEEDMHPENSKQDTPLFLHDYSRTRKGHALFRSDRQICLPIF